MNKQLVQELYRDAVALCDKQEAWLFEENFTRVLVERCCQLLERDAEWMSVKRRILSEGAEMLRETFGVKQ